MNRYLHSAAYCLGEVEIHYSKLANYESKLKQMRIPLAPEVGLGCIRMTTDVYALMRRSIATTIAQFGVRPHTVKHVIYCSSHFGDRFARRKENMATALIENGINPRNIRGVSGMGCTDLLHGLEIASNMLNVGESQSVLVVGIEEIAEKNPLARLRDYAIFSDAAVSFIVSNSPGPSGLSATYKSVAHESTALLAEIGVGMPISNAKAYAQCIGDVLKKGRFVFVRHQKDLWKQHIQNSQNSERVGGWISNNPNVP